MRFLLSLFMSVNLAVLAVSFASNQADKEKDKVEKKTDKSDKEIMVRFPLALNSESKITVDDQPCSLPEAETLYKFTQPSLITTEMKVTDGKVTDLKLTTRK